MKSYTKIKNKRARLFDTICGHEIVTCEVKNEYTKPDSPTVSKFTRVKFRGKVYKMIRQPQPIPLSVLVPKCTDTGE